MAKELFKKPSWLKPELNQFRYWVHLVILATVTLWVIDLFIPGNTMLSVHNVLMSVPALAVGDTVAHTLLKMD